MTCDWYLMTMTDDTYTVKGADKGGERTKEGDAMRWLRAAKEAEMAEESASGMTDSEVIKGIMREAVMVEGIGRLGWWGNPGNPILMKSEEQRNLDIE